MGKKRKAVRRLLASELEILQMLWNAGAVTIAEAHRALGQAVGYTTVQTRLNRMVKKGTVIRSRERPARYEAAVAPEDVRAEDLNLLVEKASGGCVVPLVAHLVQDQSLTASEVDELKRLISQAERRIRKHAREGGRP